MLQHIRMILVMAMALLLGLSSQLAAESTNVAKAPNAICPILIGSELPAMTLQDLEGKKFDLNKAIAEKPTILIYFRGGW